MSICLNKFYSNHFYYISGMKFDYEGDISLTSGVKNRRNRV